MKRMLIAAGLLLLCLRESGAEPLPWTYYLRFQSAGGAKDILLGSESNLGTTQYITYHTGIFGPSTLGIQLNPGTSTVRSFGYGDWSISSTPPNPSTTSNGTFDFFWGFQGPTQSINGIDHGTIAASGVFTSGSGNFWIGFDESHDITLDGKRAIIQFQGYNNESTSGIQMTVTPVAISETPEPETWILAIIGVVSVCVFRYRCG